MSTLGVRDDGEAFVAAVAGLTDDGTGFGPCAAFARLDKT
jgi:hypothetical protein